MSLSGTHGETNDQGAPLGSGALLLIGFGAAYFVGKKRKEE
ncbi:MAG: LPXTG cell wall anchor domain-containing protein [Bacteroidales bacterium]|nr:LPXTG cell wall anchor domain-containing protein [Bacteroidales bacterium]